MKPLAAGGSNRIYAGPLSLLRTVRPVYALRSGPARLVSPGHGPRTAMARKRKKKSRGSGASDASGASGENERQGSPFNNPFADGMKSIKRALKKARDERPVAKKKKAVEEKKFVDDGLDDTELFRRAAAGAQAVRARGREVTHKLSGDFKPRVRVEDVDTSDFLADEYFDIRFSDRFIRGRAREVSRDTFEKLEEGLFAVRSHVDLHGMAFDDAKQTVDEFLADCQRRGERCVLVITGKGRNSPGQVGVLRQGIPEWLSRGPSARRVLAFVTARQCDGGEGALYVLLRMHAGRKRRIEVESGGGA